MSPPNSTWRLIDTGPLSGPENMAVDEALLNCFLPGTSTPVFRLYGWEPPAFSCGRFQQPEEILDLDHCRAAGIPVVQRITGGGVIYHASELTYSLVCPVDFIPGSQSVRAAFFRLTSFLITFYRNLGLAPEYAADHFGGAKRLGGRTTLCFAGIESCDILLAGKKIGGNAQRRLKNAIFQHGSIPLRQMAVESRQYLLSASPDLDAATTALDVAGVAVDRATLGDRLAAAFAATFSISFRPDSLASEEQQRVAGYMQKSA